MALFEKPHAQARARNRDLYETALSPALSSAIAEKDKTVPIEKIKQTYEALLDKSNRLSDALEEAAEEFSIPVDSEDIRIIIQEITPYDGSVYDMKVHKHIMEILARPTYGKWGKTYEQPEMAVLEEEDEDVLNIILENVEIVASLMAILNAPKVDATVKAGGAPNAAGSTAATFAWISSAALLLRRKGLGGIVDKMKDGLESRVKLPPRDEGIEDLEIDPVNMKVKAGRLFNWGEDKMVEKEEELRSKNKVDKTIKAKRSFDLNFANKRNIEGSITAISDVPAKSRVSKSYDEHMTEEAKLGNDLMDALAAGLTISIGPEQICCAAKYLGASFDLSGIETVIKMIRMGMVALSGDFLNSKDFILNMISSAQFRDVRVRLLAILEMFISKVIGAVEEALIGLIKNDKALEALIKCQFMKGLVGSIKKMARILKAYFFKKLREMKDEYNFQMKGLKNFSIDIGDPFGFDGNGMIELLGQIQQILRECNKHSTLEDRAADFNGNGLSSLALAQPLISLDKIQNESSDPFSNFIYNKPVKFSNGAQLYPGVQTDLNIVDNITKQDIMNSCYSGVSADTLREETSFIRALFSEDDA